MRQSVSLFQRPAEILISSAFLALNLLFTFAYFFVAPYSGIYFNPSDGEILTIFIEAESATLQEGDVIKEIGDISWSEYATNGTVIFFENAQLGDVVNVKVSRNGADLTIPWAFPGFNPAEFRNRFFNLWWLGYFFWVFGMLTQLFIRPRDARWRLLSLSSYLTGFWVIVGTVSASQVWGSSLLLHATTWLMAPVYLHLHWSFPKPLSERASWVWVALYLAGFALAVAELLAVISRLLYGLGFFLALVGSVILLVAHAIRQPAQRRDVALLAIAFALASFPSIILAVAGVANKIPQIGPLALVSLPIIPATYFFIVYRRQLGELETRANRAFSIYLYLCLLGALLLFLLAVSALSPISQGALMFSGALFTLLTALVSVLGFPIFQRLVDQRLLGIKLPYQNLLETYSARIATSASTASLIQLLEQDVFPSLLVRQYAFVEVSGDAPRVVLVRGVEVGQLPNLDDAPALTSLAGHFILPEDGHPHSWIRLILTLRAGEETLGLWLLGRRDPDDLYHADEIPIFQSLADQTAIALSNLLQEERLRSLYQSDIQRREQERLTLARELHDSVLNQLAALRMNLGDTKPSPRFEEAYEGVVQRLREIVSDLRPPMINYGLKLALEELAQTLMERNENRLRVTLALVGEERQYPPNITLHLFRIVQESCENAMHHAKASNIVITAQWDERGIVIEIKDDGVGFEMGERMDLNELLAHKHFGLAGIVERANLIEADASIQSAPETGTRVRVVWRAAAEGQG